MPSWGISKKILFYQNLETPKIELPTSLMGKTPVEEHLKKII